METLHPRLLPPPTARLGLGASCFPIEETLINITQKEYLMKLEQRLHRMQRGPAEVGDGIFKRGTAAELRRIANATAEQAHMERRHELLESPLVNTIADAPRGTYRTNTDADTESLLGSAKPSAPLTLDPERRYLIAGYGGESSSSGESDVDIADDETPSNKGPRVLGILEEDTICAGCFLH
jgi:hypothetical protein